MSNTSRHDRLLKASLAELRPIEREIDWGCIDRIAAYRNYRREEMGEAAWAELVERDWNMS
jgi:hypothetical protein